MKRMRAQHRLFFILQRNRKNSAGENAAQEDYLPDVEYLSKVFDDGIIAGNHRHRDDDRQRGLEVIGLQ